MNSNNGYPNNSGWRQRPAYWVDKHLEPTKPYDYTCGPFFVSTEKKLLKKKGRSNKPTRVYMLPG